MQGSYERREINVCLLCFNEAVQLEAGEEPMPRDHTTLLGLLS